jgi:hypothetical protein
LGSRDKLAYPLAFPWWQITQLLLKIGWISLEKLTPDDGAVVEPAGAVALPLELQAEVPNITDDINIMDTNTNKIPARLCCLIMTFSIRPLLVYFTGSLTQFMPAK